MSAATIPGIQLDGLVLTSTRHLTAGQTIGLDANGTPTTDIAEQAHWVLVLDICGDGDYRHIRPGGPFRWLHLSADAPVLVLAEAGGQDQ